MRIRVILIILCCLLCVFAGATPQKSKPDPKAAATAKAEKKEIQDYRLTAEKLDRYESSVIAYNKLLAANPDMKKEMHTADSSNGNSVTGNVEKLDKHPEIVALLKNAGFTTREWVVMTYCLMNTAMEVGMKNSGTEKTYSSSIAPENAALVEKNYERVSKILDSLGGDEDDDTQ